MSDAPLRLFLFTADLDTALRADAAGVDSVIVDWERHGKHARQRGHDTEINDHSVASVSRLSSRLDIPVTVRLNPLHEGTRAEVRRALNGGASTLMLPMAESPAEVEAFVRIVAGRARTLIQIETQALADRCAALRSIDWDYVHVGLNDLKISRGDTWLWAPLLDGTIERIHRALAGRVVGFGGATVIGGGVPIPFVGLLQEMARLHAGMALLRRSFLREAAGRDWKAELRAVRATWDALHARAPAAERRDHAALTALLRTLSPAPQSAPSPRPSAVPFGRPASLPL
jgi:hypothetical protein